jgi:hypothetical protein
MDGRNRHRGSFRSNEVRPPLVGGLFRECVVIEGGGKADAGGGMIVTYLWWPISHLRVAYFGQTDAGVPSAFNPQCPK